MAIAIAKAESGMRCGAVGVNKNGTIDRGIFQLNSAFHPPLFNCLDNIKKAKQIYDQWGSFNAWTTYRNGKVVSR